jgi:hypothetical protein
MLVYVKRMTHMSIRDLQKISGETIGALPGPTPVKSGDRTVGLLVPLKAADPDRLAAVLARAEALAAGRDPAADDAALAPFGEQNLHLHQVLTGARDNGVGMRGNSLWKIIFIIQ